MWDNVLLLATTILEAVTILAISTLLFDALHWCLHQWRDSRVPLLRWANGLHQVHHDFLDKSMQVHPELARANIWAHIVPEYLTTMAGTALFLPFLPVATGLVMLRHTIALGYVLWVEGRDFYHMAKTRLDGRLPVLHVNDDSHALHHVFPMTRYGSVYGLFDLIFGTAVQLRGRTVAITGASGVLGSALYRALLDADVKELHFLKHGRDYETGRISDAAAASLAKADLLILAHGAREGAVFNANVATFALLGDRFIRLHKDDLVPPEIWAVGSETELMGWSRYARSKRAFAREVAARWFASPDVIYRHICPGAFASPMGWGPMSGRFVAAAALFLIRRGCRYVPVTFSGGALLNWFKFRWLARRAA